jgi:hypothetical protein
MEKILAHAERPALIKEKNSWLSHTKELVHLEIVSNLYDREEEFKLVALAMVTSLPLLFIGPSGVAKSQVVEEFASALSKKGATVYSYQVDDYTHPSEIKGKPDMEKFFNKEQPQYLIDCPIKDVDFIFLDEIHNANSGYKNAIMSILAERELLVGRDRIKLPYKAFVATCNEIPRTEKSKAFWDRFIFKHTVSRLSISGIMSYLTSGHKNSLVNYNIDIPGANEINGIDVDFPIYKIELLISVCYSSCSDRTVMNLPLIVKAIIYIWKVNIDQAIIKTASLLAGIVAAKELTEKLNSKEFNAIHSKIELLNGIQDDKLVEEMVQDISILLSVYQSNGTLTVDQVTALKVTINLTLSRKKSYVRIE